MLAHSFFTPKVYYCSSSVAVQIFFSSKCADRKNKGVLAKECHGIQQRATANHLLQQWNTANVFLSRGMCLGKLNLLPGTDATLIKKLESFIALSVYTGQRVFVQCG